MWNRVNLCDFLKQRKEQVLIESDIEYSLVTISNRGEVKLREKKKGGLINAQKGYCVKAGDFIYSRLAVHTGAFGIIPRTLDGALVTNEMPSFEINDSKIHPDILISLLSIPAVKWQLNQLTKGMGRVRIKESMLLALTVLLPPRKEQDGLARKISSTNIKLNKLNSQLTHQQTLLKKLRQQILQEAIEGKLTIDFRAQNPDIEPAGELLARIKAEKEKLIKEKKIKKQKPLPPIREEEKPFELPEGWVWCRLQDITRLITDGKHGDCQNMFNSGYYFLSAKDIQNGELIYNNARQIVPDEFQEVHNRTDLEPGDICMVNTGATVGKTALAPDHSFTRKTTFQKSVAVIKVVKPNIDQRFIKILLVCETSKLLATSWGSAINNLLLGDLKKQLVPLPPLPEQKAIATKVEKLLAICDQLEAQITTNQTHTEQLMQAVLKEAFSQSGEA